MENVTIKITDIEGDMVHYIATVERENGRSEVGGIVEKGDEIHVGELISRDSENLLNDTGEDLDEEWMKLK